MLDSMVPAFGATAAKAPCRAAFVYFPNGVQMDSWVPATEGEIARLPDALPRVLEPLAAYRDDVMVLGGLTVDGGRAKGDGPGDHGRAGASYLTGAHPKKTFGKDIQAGVSVDQYAAAKIGGQTRFASLELGCEEGIQGGNCDNGYSCAYSNSISWRTPSTPNPPEIRPRAVFERLFGAADEETDPARRARRERNKRAFSIRCWETRRSCRANWAARTAASWTSIYTPSAISKRASSGAKTSQPRSGAAARRAALQRSGELQRAHPADVRPDDRGVPDRLHSHHHVPDGD